MHLRFAFPGGFRCFAAVAAVCIPFLLSACGSGPTRVEASIVGVEDLNPDPDGQPKPLVIRIYELTSETAFKAASFEDLNEADLGRLGTELQAREEFLLTPGQTLEFERDLQPKTKFLGFAGNYRLYELGGLWRTSVSVPEGDVTELKITFDRGAISVEVD